MVRKISRQKTDEEVENFFVANFISCTDPQFLWIGEIVKNGEQNYNDWQRRVQSLSYNFKQETEVLFSENKFEEVFKCSKGHPPVLKSFLSGKISLETLVICDKIFLFGKKFDKKLLDPVWETVSLKISKYSPFLNIDVFQFKRILREIINE